MLVAFLVPTALAIAVVIAAVMHQLLLWLLVVVALVCPQQRKIALRLIKLVRWPPLQMPDLKRSR